MEHDGESGGPGKERGRRGVPSWNLSRWGEKRALSIKLELYFGPPHAAEGVGIPLCRFESGGGGGGAEYTAARYGAPCFKAGIHQDAEAAVDVTQLVSFWKPPSLYLRIMAL